MRGLKFVTEFVRHPTQIGAIAASSRALARLMVEAAHVAEAQVIVEFGPGTGVFTRQIVATKRPSADFFAIELNPRFVDELGRLCPGVTVYQDSAVEARKYLELRGHRQCDCIVCGLPWASFGHALQDALIDSILEILEPGGRFVTFAYLQGLLLPAGAAFRKKLRSRFNRVETTRTVWRNLPPAFVYAVTR